MIIGVSAGAVQGYFGGKTDLIFQRFMEIWSAIQRLYVLIILENLLKRSLPYDGSAALEKLGLEPLFVFTESVTWGIIKTSRSNSSMLKPILLHSSLNIL